MTVQLLKQLIQVDKNLNLADSLIAGGVQNTQHK